MKKIHFYTPILIVLFLFNVQTSEAQFFKKLKQKLSKKEKSVPKFYVSDNKQVFKNWDQGASDIIAYVFTEQDVKKRSHMIGNITEDGSFTYKLPDSIGTFVPISRYAEECTNVQEAVIKNTEVKLGLVQLHVGQNKKFIGSLSTIHPKETIDDLGSYIKKNGEKGNTYLVLYADGEASVHIKCKKKITIPNQKGQGYEDELDTESIIALDLKKGWNILRKHVTENISVGMALHITKNELTIVDALPNDSMWVYQPTKK